MRRVIRVPDLLLERLALGELPEAEAAAVRSRLDAEPGGKERLSALEDSNEEILKRYAPRSMAARIEGSMASKGRVTNPVRWWIPAAPLAAAALAVVVWVAVPETHKVEVHKKVVNHTPHPPAYGSETERVKGKPQLMVFRERDGDDEQLDDGDLVAQGDLLQVKYRAGDARYGVLISIDGRGSVTLHFPETPHGSTKLELGGAVTLHRSYELDDAPAFERFILVASREPLVVEDILRSAGDLANRATEALVSEEGQEQIELLLRKDDGGITP